MKLDDIFMILAKVIGIGLLLVILYALGMFDMMLGESEFFINYHNR
jgi:hypothetical protein